MRLFRTSSKKSSSQDMTPSFVTSVMLPRDVLPQKKLNGFYLNPAIG